MTRLQPSNGLKPVLVLLALIGLAATCRADAMYSFTDLGPTGDLQDPVFTASGQIGSVSSLGSIRLKDGPYSVTIRTTEVWPHPGDGPNDSYLSAAGQPTVTLNTRFGSYQSVQASAVNRSGMVVGTDVGNPGDIAHTFGVPFVYSQAAGMRVIPMPYANNNLIGAFGTGYARSINDAGMIVGGAYGKPGDFQHPLIGFLSDGQHSWDLNTLIAPGSGWLLTSATDIDDKGRIVGVAYQDVFGPHPTAHAYLLTPLATPTPEPASWLILATGGIAITLGRAVKGAWSRRAGPLAG